jgi:hypothetical protein
MIHRDMTERGGIEQRRAHSQPYRDMTVPSKGMLIGRSAIWSAVPVTAVVHLDGFELEPFGS